MIKAKEGGNTVTIFVLIINIFVIFFALWTMVIDTIPSLIEEYQMKYEQTVAALALIKEKFSNAGLKDKLGIQEDQGENKSPDSAVGAVGATQGSVTLSEADVNSKIHDLFARYDLD